MRPAIITADPEPVIDTGVPPIGLVIDGHLSNRDHSNGRVMGS